MNRCFEILYRYEIEIITFNELDISDYLFSKKITIKYYDKSYFSSLNGYNQLLLSWDFYNNYKDYKYILIYQLDSFVFSDKLKFWCSKDYDYIGSPWIVNRKNINFKNLIITTIYWVVQFFKEMKMPLCVMNQVGNGGFSLRRVSKFLYVLENINSRILQKYISATANEIKYNEDVFWSLEINNYPKLKLNKPSPKEALCFSIDGNPKHSISNMKEMPFGCHGWNKSNQVKNWLDIINI